MRLWSKPRWSRFAEGPRGPSVSLRCRGDGFVVDSERGFPLRVSSTRLDSATSAPSLPYLNHYHVGICFFFLLFLNSINQELRQLFHINLIFYDRPFIVPIVSMQKRKTRSSSISLNEKKKNVGTHRHSRNWEVFFFSYIFRQYSFFLSCILAKFLLCTCKTKCWSIVR